MEVYFPRRPHDTFHPLIWELKRRSAWKYVSSVEAPKEPQPLWNKNAGGMKEYQCLSSENLNQRKQRWQQERINLLSFVDNMQRSIVTNNSIVRCCNVTWNTVSIYSVPDATERIDERNLSTSRKTTLVPTEKLFLNPARTKLLWTRIEE